MPRMRLPSDIEQVIKLAKFARYVLRKAAEFGLAYRVQPVTPARCPFCGAAAVTGVARKSRERAIEKEKEIAAEPEFVVCDVCHSEIPVAIAELHRENCAAAAHPGDDVD